MRSLILLCVAPLVATALAFGPVSEHGATEVYFTPWDNAEGALLKVIRSARHSIHIQAYTFTSRNIAHALGEARQRGVRVDMLVDAEQLRHNDSNLIDRLHQQGIGVWLETRYAAAHNKVMVIDIDSAQPVVVTGSYNFSFAAQARNAENLLILRGQPKLAQAYFANWQRHRREAEPFGQE